jgi:nucleotide-binding universal stress UspA family protein
VLVACDFSAAAERALDWAARLQGRLPATTVHLLHVWTTPAPMAAVPMPMLGPTDEDVAGIVRELETVAARHGLRADARVEVQVSPVSGPAIVDQAAALGCDLIVMGTHGRGAVARAVLGSVADWVVRHASCPVVILR